MILKYNSFITESLDINTEKELVKKAWEDYTDEEAFYLEGKIKEFFTDVDNIIDVDEKENLKNHPNDRYHVLKRLYIMTGNGLPSITNDPQGISRLEKLEKGLKPCYYYSSIIVSKSEDEFRDIINSESSNRLMKFFIRNLSKKINNKSLEISIRFWMVNSSKNQSAMDIFIYHKGFEEKMNQFIDEKGYVDSVKGQLLLNYLKYIKPKKDPARSQMESENTMYVFIARPKFVKNKSGSYDKDIDIENLVPIDPYDAKDAQTISMMGFRARSQGIDSKVYCIWLPNDMEGLDNINSDDMRFLRELIDNKKEPI